MEAWRQVLSWSQLQEAASPSSYIYQFPVGHSRKWLANSNKLVDGLLGGWEVSGITTFHSGDPLTLSLENPGIKGGWLATWVNRVPGTLYAGRQSGHDTVDGVQWFNTGAFAPPQPWTFGNAEPGVLFGPGFGDWDVSVMKSFKMPGPEPDRLDFKVAFFNLHNHYNLGDPNPGIADTRDGGLPDPTSGKIYSGPAAYQPRLIQIGLRFSF